MNGLYAELIKRPKVSKPPNHHAPFQSPRHLAADLAMGLWLVIFAYGDAAIVELKHWRIVRLP